MPQRSKAQVPANSSVAKITISVDRESLAIAQNIARSTGSDSISGAIRYALRLAKSQQMQPCNEVTKETVTKLAQEISKTEIDSSS
jgi:hypothetical protein